MPNLQLKKSTLLALVAAAILLTGALGRMQTVVANFLRSADREIAEIDTARTELQDVEESQIAKLEISGGTGASQWESFEQMHEFYEHSFVESEGFGISRILTFDEPQDRRLKIEGQPYTVAKLNLIGLMKAEGQVYEPSWISMMRNNLSDYPARSLTTNEEDAIRELRGGSNLVWSHHPAPFSQNRHANITELDLSEQNRPLTQDSYTLIAPLRAGASCLDCHDAKRGELLGAFVYTMSPRASFLDQIIANGQSEMVALP